MILIYTPVSTTRLQYICKFIFKEQLGIAYSLTIDADGFKGHNGFKINYSDTIFDDAPELIFNIKPHLLLFENNIHEQHPACFEINNYKAFFNTGSPDFSFDIFAASFYLLSRYEEYLPHSKDIYNRYAHENSLAFKEGFLQLPLVNLWIRDLGNALQQRDVSITAQYPSFNYIPTYDIDIAWSYKNKGFFRNLGGFVKSPSYERLAVLAGIKKDPFNSYYFLDELHAATKLNPVYFFLVATANNEYDKNIYPFNKAMWELIKQHAQKYSIGLHPSWKSNENLQVIKKEKKILETAAEMEVKNSRQHYIKFNVAETFEKITEAGIENDYSMGYGSINGFRASVASSFFWYDLKKEAITSLRMHPFCYMDANCFYEEKLTVEDAYAEILYYYNECKKVNGTFISIFHNNFLGSDKQFTGWKEMYRRFISQLPR